MENGIGVADSHKEYKRQKARQRQYQKESSERFSSLSNTTKAERASVQLSPLEEFECIWKHFGVNTGDRRMTFRWAVISGYAVAAIVAYVFPSIAMWALGIAFLGHVISLLRDLGATRSGRKDIVLASQMNNPEFDRRGRRLRDRGGFARMPQRTTNEILNDWDRDRRYGL